MNRAYNIDDNSHNAAVITFILLKKPATDQVKDISENGFLTYVANTIP